MMISPLRQSLTPTLLPALALAFLLAGAGAQARSLPHPEEPAAVPPGVIAAEASNVFGQELFTRILAQKPGENVFVSPVSAHLALSLAALGATGENQREMNEVLRVKTPDAARTGSRALIDSLNTSREGFRLTTANSLWVHKDYTLKNSYQTMARTAFDAESQSLDFLDPRAAERINHWVDQHTAGKIPSIVDPPSLRAQSLVLINATYFKADWTVPFRGDRTHPEPFHLVKGGTKDVPMMSRTGHDMRYLQSAEGEALEIPYGPEASASFVLWMPARADAPFSDKAFRALANVEPSFGEVRLPKFRLEAKYSLGDVLQAMGMRRAFQSGGFANLSETPMRISEVLQKTFLQVDEQGTEAAAVTSIGFEATGGMLTPAFMMNVDRPFYFGIRDNRSGAWLFLGRIESP
jgi:serine protease inhibitor